MYCIYNIYILYNSLQLLTFNNIMIIFVNIFLISNVVDKIGIVHQLYIDIKKAYDSINRQRLYNIVKIYLKLG